jgi:hypothetical protein
VTDYRERGFETVSDVQWGSYAVFVGGANVTTVGGVPTVLESYQRIEPGGYGPAVIRFPKMSPHVKLGIDYPWLRIGAQAKIRRRRPDGTLGRVIWKGQVVRPSRATVGLTLACDGELVGRASAIDKLDELVFWTKDAGVLLADGLRLTGRSVVPALGPTTGIKIAERTLSGGSVWDYVLGLLALTQKADGTSYTVRPRLDGKPGYAIVQKDRETIAASIMANAKGVNVDLSEDLTEAPNRFYGYGRDPFTNELWTNACYPGLMQGEAPDFPGTLIVGDTGDDVDLLQSKLSQMGFLSRADALGSTFDEETADAVRVLQKRAGLAVTGVVNAATWAALYDVNQSGPSLGGAFYLPLACDPRTEKWLYSANGSRLGLNPIYDPRVIPVTRTIDFGTMTQERATRWCQAQVDLLLEHGPGLAGTITLTADAWAGDTTHNEAVAGADQFSRLDFIEGQNIKLWNVEGGGLVMHIAQVDVTPNEQGPPTVRLLVDTRARDALDLGARKRRDRESRVNQHRAFRSSRKARGRKALPEATKDFGWLWMRKALPANTFVSIPVPAGQAGTLNRVRARLGVPREFFEAVTADKMSAAQWRHILPAGPFADGAMESEKVRQKIEDAGVLLYAAGSDKNPCGYYPRKKIGDDGEPTGAPLTGAHLDDDPVGYHTTQGVLWWTFYVRGGDSYLRPQRLGRPQLEAGV